MPTPKACQNPGCTNILWHPHKHYCTVCERNVKKYREAEATIAGNDEAIIVLNKEINETVRRCVLEILRLECITEQSKKYLKFMGAEDTNL